MKFSAIGILAGILAELPDLSTFAEELEAEFKAIAHGEGGSQKILNATAGAAAIATTVVKVVADVQKKNAATIAAQQPQGIQG